MIPFAPLGPVEALAVLAVGVLFVVVLGARERIWDWRAVRQVDQATGMRRWSPTRQAYTPRWWPPWLVSLGLLVFEVYVWPHPRGVAEGVVAGAGSAILVQQARWWWWRRQHPVLSPEEFLAARRRSAPLN